MRYKTVLLPLIPAILLILAFTFIPDFRIAVQDQVKAAFHFYNRTYNKEKIRKEYQELISSVMASRENLGKAYRNAPDKAGRKAVLDKAEMYLFQTMSEEILPLWFGTKYDFNGTTEVPLSGTIACGYYVTTTLKQAGLDIPRGRMARNASLQMIRSFSKGRDRISVRPGQEPTKNLEQALKKHKPGLYIIGIDSHTGFILSNPKGQFFIHADWNFVKKQNIHNSWALKYQTKHGMHLGRLFSQEMVRAWLTKTHIPCPTCKKM